jgi:hypothetical protein
MSLFSDAMGSTLKIFYFQKSTNFLKNLCTCFSFQYSDFAEALIYTRAINGATVTKSSNRMHFWLLSKLVFSISC